MKISVVGAGYVGLVAAAGFAGFGNHVICVERDEIKLELLKSGKVPIFEPGLLETIKTNLNEKRLVFTGDLEYALKNSKICFITVGTPQNKDGSANIASVFDVAKKIAKYMNEYKIIVNKSTVPVGTAKELEKIIKKNSKYDFDVVSNPEFLKQGSALDDFLYPDRIIVGANSKRVKEVMTELYTPFLRTGNKILFMDTNSAEMTKYASNTYLALRISFINEIANLCEKVGADVEFVRRGMALDNRIGSKFLFPGLGFGGSCFPKDVSAMIKTGEENNFDTKIIKACSWVNLQQKNNFIQKIKERFGKLKGLTFAVWGLSYKPKTNDIREAPSVFIIEKLLKYGAKIKAYDPKAMEEAKKIFKDKIEYSQNYYDALKGADALLLLTEWAEFRSVDLDKIKDLLKNPVIFDGRNLFDLKKLKKLGFECFQIGRK